MIFDPRAKDLAHTLVNYSTKVTPGDAVAIDSIGFAPRALIEEIAVAVTKAGGTPIVTYQQPALSRKILLEGDEKTIERIGKILSAQMEAFQCYIAVRGSDNAFEMSDVPEERMRWYNQYIVKPVHLERRVKRTRWCVLRYPNEAMCQLAETSTEAFTKFYYDVCCVDYPRMAAALEPLKVLMDAAKTFRITGPGTDLEMSVAGIPSVPCAGAHNVPDGECFTAPVRDSVNGTIAFNTPSIREGVTFDNIKLTFKDGKVVDADAGAQTKKLNEVLDVDEGGRYLGEFSFGVNPVIQKPMRDTLFDEKIDGSLHMALGACYDEAPNGNESALHWDLVSIQRPDWGGGEVICDGRVIRKDGRFVVPELEGLNPENLT